MYLSEFVSPPCGWVVAQPVSFPTGEGHPAKLLPKGRRHVGAGGSGMLYILNAFSISMLPPEGAVVKVSPISLGEAKALLNEGFESAVGHESTAQLLSTLLGMEVPPRRVAIAMSPGDRAVIFQLRTRLEEGKVLSKEEVEALYQQGLASFYLVEVLQ